MYIMLNNIGAYVVCISITIFYKPAIHMFLDYSLLAGDYGRSPRSDILKLDLLNESGLIRCSR